MLLEKFRRLIADRRINTLAASAMLLLITFLAHHDALNGDWRGDDMQQLISAKDHSLFQLLFHPHAWRTFTENFFTPFLAGQYQLDILLFGYNPHGFFFHNLADLAATAILTYHFLARRSPPLLSVLACFCFLLTMPTFGMSAFLMSRHYLAGLFFAIASIYMHQNAYRGNLTRNLLASAGLFFLALMCKEIYAMVLLYFLLRSWRSPAFAKSLVLYPLLLAIFIAWRWHMLGGLVGGYDFDGSFLDRVRALACVHRAIFGSDAAAVVCLGVVTAVAVYHRLFDRKRLIYLVAFVLAAYMPLLFATFMIYYVPVSSLRFAFFPAWLLFAGMTYIATLLWEKGNQKTAGVVLLGFLAMTTMTSVRQVEGFRNSLKDEDVQATFIRNGGPASAIFLTSAFSSLDGNIFRRLAELGGYRPSNIIVSQDDVVPGITSFWEYDHHCRCMVRLSQAQVDEKLAKLPKLPADNAPISLLTIWQARRGMVSLITAPDLKSTCQVTIPGALSDCPKESEFLKKVIPTDRMDWSRTRIRRTRNDGLVTSTPFLQIPWSGTIQWNRVVFLPIQPQPLIQSGRCRIDTPLQKTIQLKPADPMEIRGWIQAPSDIKLDAVPFATLNGAEGKRYTTNLYRTPRPEVEQSTGQTVIGAHILDADFNRVAPGTYRLLLGIENALCDTGTILVMESP